MRSHLVKEAETVRCIYCTNDLGDLWKSVWHEGHHYKIRRCDCGKTNRIKVDFDGSGHDGWKAGEFEVKVNEETMRLHK